MIFGVSLKMQSVSKNYVLLQDERNNQPCAYYKIGMCLTLKKFTLKSAVRDIYRIATKSFFRT